VKENILQAHSSDPLNQFMIALLDVQAIWKSLTPYMPTSTRADTTLEDLLGKIPSERLTADYKKYSSIHT